MSVLGRLRAWLRLDTDGHLAGDGRGEAAEREMEARLRAVEARLVAVAAAARREADELQRRMEGR